jgi:hypothetical protein
VIGASETAMSSHDREKVLWQTYTSWNQFAWLYLVGLIAAFRGALLWSSDLSGWEMWIIGAVALIALSGFLRYWVRYTVTSHRVVVTNAFTGREIQAMALVEIGDATVEQELAASLLGIGTLVIRSSSGDQVIRLRGIHDPDSAVKHLETVRRREVYRGTPQALP